MLILRLTAIVVLGLWVWGASTISAQYPPVTTSTECPGFGNVDPNTTVPVTAAIVDAAGDPVEGVEVEFSILSQPGNSAFLDPETATTKASGIATTTLHTGDTAGTIVMSCGGTSLISEVRGVSTFVPPVVGDAGLVGTRH